MTPESEGRCQRCGGLPWHHNLDEEGYEMWEDEAGMLALKDPWDSEPGARRIEAFTLPNGISFYGWCPAFVPSPSKAEKGE